MAFARNALLVAGGMAFAQGLQAAATPFLARLYTPADFGVSAVVLGVAALFQVVACCRYELAIVLPARDEDAASVFALAVLVSTLTAVVLVLAVLAFGAPLAAAVGVPGRAGWLWTVPVLALSTGLYQASMYWTTRTEAFGALGGSRVALAVTTVGLQLGAGLLGRSGPEWLVGGTVGGQLVGTAWLLAHALSGRRRPALAGLRWTALWRSAVEYRRFPIFNVPYVFLGALRDRTLLFLMGALASTQAVGLFSVASKLSFLPVSLIGMSVSVVFFQRAAAERDRAALGVFVSGLLERFALLGAPALVLFAWDAPPLFGLILGGPWLEAGDYARLLAAPALFMLMNTALDRTLDVLGRQSLALGMEVVSLVVSLGAFSAATALSGDPLTGVAAYAAVMVAYHSGWLLVVYRVAGFPLAGLGRAALAFAGTLAGAASLHALVFASLGRRAGLVVVAVLAAAYYAWAAWSGRRSRSAVA